MLADQVKNLLLKGTTDSLETAISLANVPFALHSQVSSEVCNELVYCSTCKIWVTTEDFYEDDEECINCYSY